MDHLNPRQRSLNMSRVKGRDTSPEKKVRKLLSKNGFRYRLHSAAVEGRPDIVLGKYRAAIFIHGCFWHRHSCRRGASMPISNVKFWNTKFIKNKARDMAVRRSLRRAGWRYLTIWECELKNDLKVEKKLLKFLT